MEDKGSSKKEKERQKKEEKEEKDRQKREEKERLKREETQEKLRKKEEKQRKKEEEGGKKKGFFSKLKLKLKHGEHGGTRTSGSQKADDKEFVFMGSEEKEKEGATGGASVTAEGMGISRGGTGSLLFHVMFCIPMYNQDLLPVQCMSTCVCECDS